MKTFALADAAKMVHELTLAYGQPYGLSTAATEDLAKQWAKVLDDCHPDHVRTVVEQWIKREKKWPTASRVRDDALKIAATQRVKSTPVEGEFCPMCHTQDLIAVGPHQRFMPYHADNCPGLHDDDRKALRTAIEADQPVWKGGKAPTESTPERLRKHQQRELHPQRRQPLPTATPTPEPRP